MENQTFPIDRLQLDDTMSEINTLINEGYMTSNEIDTDTTEAIINSDNN